MTQQLVDTDIGKTTYVDWLLPHSQTDGLYAYNKYRDYLQSPLWGTPREFFVKLFTGGKNKSQLEALFLSKRLDLPASSDFVIHMPRVSSDSSSGYAGLGAGSILQIAVTSRQAAGGALGNSSRSKISFEVIAYSLPGKSGTKGQPPVAIRIFSDV